MQAQTFLTFFDSTCLSWIKITIACAIVFQVLVTGQTIVQFILTTRRTTGMIDQIRASVLIDLNKIT